MGKSPKRSQYIIHDKIQFLGLKFDDLTLDKSVARVEQFIKEKKPHMVFTTGAELIVRARWDEVLRKIYLKSDLLIIDSSGVHLVARLLRRPFGEPVSGTRLMFRFLELNASKGYRFYFLGSTRQILKEAVERLEARYPSLNIVGWHHGYFDFKNDSSVVTQIVEARPDVLFVAMSTPLKERFVSKNLKKMNVPVSIGVGGGVDVAAGHHRLAPKWLSKMGLEWFYRLIQEPGRLWKRYAITNPIFLWLVVKEFFKS